MNPETDPTSNQEQKTHRLRTIPIFNPCLEAHGSYTPWAYTKYNKAIYSYETQFFCESIALEDLENANAAQLEALQLIIRQKIVTPDGHLLTMEPDRHAMDLSIYNLVLTFQLRERLASTIQQPKQQPTQTPTEKMLRAQCNITPHY
jgi:hypothetical protein